MNFVLAIIVLVAVGLAEVLQLASGFKSKAPWDVKVAAIVFEVAAIWLAIINL